MQMLNMKSVRTDSQRNSSETRLGMTTEVFKNADYQESLRRILLETRKVTNENLTS